MTAARPMYGKRLQELRVKADLRQEDLAEKSGVNLSTLRGYEQCRRNPSWREFLDICKAINADPMLFDACGLNDPAALPKKPTQAKVYKFRRGPKPPG
jgi:transcriptional regulator with XRE-family HTH domain